MFAQFSHVPSRELNREAKWNHSEADRVSRTQNYTTASRSTCSTSETGFARQYYSHALYFPPSYSTDEVLHRNHRHSRCHHHISKMAEHRRDFYIQT